MKATNLSGPFDHLDYEDKTKVQFMIPESLYVKLFKKIFLRKGAQDKIMCNLLLIFIDRCKQHGLPEEYNSVNEKIAAKVLQEFKQLTIHAK